MEATTIAPPSIPRLRVLRQSYETSRTSIEPQAGPSRLPMDSENVSNDEEEQEQAVPSQVDLKETPAARLRAVLGKLHDNSQKDQSMPQPDTPSEFDSDFDPPAKLTASATSFAQKSLMDVFSHARREPGDTPQKGKSVRRRNSVGESHAFASPRAQRIQQERQQNKGNRKSLSDEEVENASFQRSDLSSRSSQAATFDTLRERLTSSYTPLRNQEPPTFLIDSPSKLDSADSPRNFDSSQATPPAATSTPQQSLHISTNSAYSNLLDQDTEMQQVMKGLDTSYDTSAHQITTSTARLPSFHDSLSKSRIKHSPELKHRHSLSTSLSRQGSTTSLHSVEDERSSRASSAISHTEYLEHIKELEKERNHEREREWNRNHSSTSNPNSITYTHAPRPEGRVRTHSHPSRPDSALSLRPSSSASSNHSYEEEEELKAEQDHERERNWNAPRPKWQTHHSHSGHSQHRSSSPLLQSPTSSPTTNYRIRTTSLSAGGTSKGQSPSTRSASEIPSRSAPMTNGKGYSSRQKTPLQRPLSYPARPNSPLPQTSRDTSTRSSVSSSQRPRTTDSNQLEENPRFTHTRAPSSPSPAPKTPSSSRHSHIPVRSPSRKVHASQSPISTLEVPASLSKVSSNASKLDDELGTEDLAAQDKTPTMKSVKALASAEHVPLPRSPSPTRTMNSNSPTPAASQPLSPPPSPPSESPSPARPLYTKPLFSLPSTPPSRPSFSVRVEFLTPSSPKGLPDLPDPPSGDEEKENHYQSPGRPGQDNTSTFKTPKVPGAYFTPARPLENRFTRAPSLPPEEDLSSTDSGLATPAASMSRASSLTLQTPAVPGGWVNTTLKSVRFDSQPTTPATPSSVTTDLSSVSEAASVSGALKVSAGVQVRPQTPPISPSSRDAYKHTGIRVVDEFGRERESMVVDTPRNKSTVRIVDAMGREVDDTEERTEIKAPRKDALLHIHQGISQLGKELEAAAAEQSNNVLIDSGHIKELNEISKAARKIRTELLSGPIRASMRQTKFMSADRRHWRWKFWAAALAQFFFCLLFFSWLSGMRARHLFLTTYYDPFYHDLHLYMIKPADYRSPSWSVMEVFRRQGTRAVVMQLLRDASLTLADWRKSVWDLWGDEVQTPPWPPT